MDTKCVVLFSGGLDSSVAACAMIERGYDIDLLHINTGALISNHLPYIRKEEIEKAYPMCKISLQEMASFGYFRKLALTTLEDDILKYKVSMICIGCKLAMHVCTIRYCVNNGIKIAVDGSCKRQERYAEQRELTINAVKKLYSTYGIEYSNPIYMYDKTAIKYGLFDRGITLQPLEDTCLFSHTFSVANDDMIREYLINKLPACKELIERSISYERNR